MSDEPDQGDKSDRPPKGYRYEPRRVRGGGGIRRVHDQQLQIGYRRVPGTDDHEPCGLGTALWFFIEALHRTDGHDALLIADALRRCINYLCVVEAADLLDRGSSQRRAIERQIAFHEETIALLEHELREQRKRLDQFGRVDIAAEDALNLAYREASTSAKPANGETSTKH